MTHQDLDTLVLKLVNHQRMLNKGVTKVRIQNPLLITVIKGDTLLMFAGVEEPISKIYPKARVIATSATCKVI